MFMNEKGLPPSLDEALANVNPERRRFLGMLLAGAAALPLLTSTELAVGEGMGKKEEPEKKDKKDKKGEPKKEEPKKPPQ
jgi:hypothetical protein